MYYASQYDIYYAGVAWRWRINKLPTIICGIFSTNLINSSFFMRIQNTIAANDRSWQFNVQSIIPRSLAFCCLSLNLTASFCYLTATVCGSPVSHKYNYCTKGLQGERSDTSTSKVPVTLISIPTCGTLEPMAINLFNHFLHIQNSLLGKKS